MTNLKKFEDSTLMNLSKLRLITKTFNSLFTELKTLIGAILEPRRKEESGTYQKLRK